MGSGLDAAKGIWVSRSPNRLGFFKISQRGGRKKKDRKKEKRNERGGTGLSAPEASASATSAASPSSARPPRAQNPNFALCLGQHGVPTDPVGMALHSIFSPASLPCQLCPWSWQLRCGQTAQLVPKPVCSSWGTSALELALGEASPACRAPMHPHLPAQFQHQGRHMKDVSLGKSCGRRGSVLPVPSLRMWSITSLSSLITKIPWDLTCTLPSIPTAVGAGI